jgi:hypothetical protein
MPGYIAGYSEILSVECRIITVDLARAKPRMKFIRFAASGAVRRISAMPSPAKRRYLFTWPAVAT